MKPAMTPPIVPATPMIRRSASGPRLRGGRSQGEILGRRHRCNEAIAVLGHRLDKPRLGRVVAQLPPDRPDALRQRFIGDRNAAPHLLQEAVLRDELAVLADQQRERIEITAVELDVVRPAPQMTVVRVEHEFLESEALGHRSAKPPCLSQAKRPCSRAWPRQKKRRSAETPRLPFFCFETLKRPQLPAPARSPLRDRAARSRGPTRSRYNWRRRKPG